MVTVVGFPRPLYPPDAAKHGKQPSMDGSDIEAYKRTVSRAGRWPWQPFDDSYSNGFAHGTGGNLINTGIAGVQRQQHIDATGWLGKTTFNALRSIRIPAGLPHAGEPAMDATAVELVNWAYAQFEGSEPPPPGMGTVRGAALARATREIGVAESPPESNTQKYGAWYGMNGVPWCAIFTSWCYELGGADVGKDSPSFAAAIRYSYVPYVVSDARGQLYGLRTTDDPIPGDLVCYDWAGDGLYDHIGLFENWMGGVTEFTAIDGNTSTTSDSNGGSVMRRTRSRGAQPTTFVRVAEP
jgi:hypothetical protein